MEKSSGEQGRVQKGTVQTESWHRHCNALAIFQGVKLVDSIKRPRNNAKQNWMDRSILGMVLLNIGGSQNMSTMFKYWFLTLWNLSYWSSDILSCKLQLATLSLLMACVKYPIPLWCQLFVSGEPSGGEMHEKTKERMQFTLYWLSMYLKRKRKWFPFCLLWPLFILKGALEIYLTRIQLDNIDG